MGKFFHEAGNDMAYLKAGLMGFAGAGKTYTGTNISTGLIAHMRKLELPLADKPAYFLDTETGSDWVRPRFNDAGVELRVAKTRRFFDLVPAIKEAEAEGSILLIDSITHFWTELTESYAKKKNRTRGLEFQDWAWLKAQWRTFTDIFLNSQLHIVMCGRAGFEYDFFTSDGGKRELEKTGIKMKAENETGYEPSILILMERHMDIDSKKVYRTASILKDRSDRLDGKIIRNPSFEDFEPHIAFLNLGGQHTGVDTSRSSEDRIDRDQRSQWSIDKQRKEIVLDEIQQLMVKHYPSTSKEDKLRKIELLEVHFGTRSWKKIEIDYSLEETKKGYNNMHVELEGYHPDGAKPEEQAALDAEDDNLPDKKRTPTAEEAEAAAKEEGLAAGTEGDEPEEKPKRGKGKKAEEAGA